MKFLQGATIFTFVTLASAARLCHDAILQETQLVVGPNGHQFNMSTVSCADSQSPIIEHRALLDSRLDTRFELSDRAASECTISPCFCGFTCGSFACNAPPATMSVFDCETLVNELISSSGTFEVAPLQAQLFEFGMCAYAAVNKFPNAVGQFCFDDFSQGAFGLVTTCGANEGSCFGDSGAFVIEQLFP